MYKTILVPLDGSKLAESILIHAQNLAERYGARVLFLTVEEPPIMLGVDEVVDMERYLKLRQAKREERHAYLSALQERFKTKGIATEQMILDGSPATTIVSVADRQKVDLVAMASHGWGGITRSFYGSVAAGVLNKLERPLLLVRS